MSKCPIGHRLHDRELQLSQELKEKQKQITEVVSWRDIKWERINRCIKSYEQTQRNQFSTLTKVCYFDVDYKLVCVFILGFASQESTHNQLTSLTEVQLSASCVQSPCTVKIFILFPWKPNPAYQPFSYSFPLTNI